MPNKKDDSNLILVKEVKNLSKEVKKLKSLEFMRVFKHPLKFMWFSFLKGLMIGFGSVLGATLLVGVFVFLLSKVSLIPVVGDFVENVIEEINISQSNPEQSFSDAIDSIDSQASEQEGEYNVEVSAKVPQLEDSNTN